MATVIQLSDDLLSAVRKANNWYERLPFTGAASGGPFALGVGTNNIFTLKQINGGATIPEWRAHLLGIAGTQSATAYLTVNYDKSKLGGTAVVGNLGALRAGVRPDPYVDVAATGTMSAQIQASAAVASYQFNYAMAMHRLTVGEKLLLGSGLAKKLTPDEQAALAYGTQPGQGQPLNIATGVSSGKLLVPWMLEMEHRFEAYVTKVDTLWLYATDVPTADTAIGTPVYTNGNEILVVRNIAVENDPNTNQLPTAVVALTRDTTANYLGWSCQAFADADDHGLDCFIPARSNVAFTVQSNPATSANVPVRATIWHVALTDAIAVRLGIKGRGQVSDRLYYQVLGGVA